MLGPDHHLYRMAKRHHQEMIAEGDRQRLATEALRARERPSALAARLGDGLIALGYRLKGRRPTLPH